MTELIGSLLIFGGAFFHFSASLGLLRMPDAYTRIQAATKASTLGNALILSGLAVYHPGWTFKLVLLIYFVLMTNPVSSHALSRAAIFMGAPMARPDAPDSADLADAGTKGATAP